MAKFRVRDSQIRNCWPPHYDIAEWSLSVLFRAAGESRSPTQETGNPQVKSSRARECSSLDRTQIGGGVTVTRSNEEPLRGMSSGDDSQSPPPQPPGRRCRSSIVARTTGERNGLRHHRSECRSPDARKRRAAPGIVFVCEITRRITEMGACVASDVSHPCSSGRRAVPRVRTTHREANPYRCGSVVAAAIESQP